VLAIEPETGLFVAVGDPDGRVVMNGLEWADYEAILAIRGAQSGVRLCFARGDLEIARWSETHASLRAALHRLLEIFAEARGVALHACSLTVTNRPAELAAEPDACYAVGRPSAAPDLAIEIIWPPGGLDRQRLCAGLGIRELWEWRDGHIDVYVLRGTDYIARVGSDVLPGLDLNLLVRLAEQPDQMQAAAELREALGR
jgi:Uma2 family endonuclease